VGINASKATIILRIAAEGANEDECQATMQPTVDTIYQTLGDLIFGKGVDRGAELVDLARTHEVFEQAGAWYTWNGKRMGQGKDAVSLLLNTDLELAEKIWLEVKAKAGEGLNCGQAESK
jgi:hypothetical protein